jgi:hypothetical protein
MRDSHASMEGTPIMQVRRRWSPVAEMSASDPTGALTPERQHRAAARDRSDVRNPRYVSPSVLLDVDRSGRRFPPPASIERWRETIRDDATVRAALLNPVDYEPRES